MTHVIPFQRDISQSPSLDRTRSVVIREALTTPEAADRLVLLGELSELLRAVGDYEDSIDAAMEAITIATAIGDDRRRASSSVRLATALQYGDHHADALAVFEAAIARDEPGFVAYRHFLLQHMGKCLVEMGRIIEARSALNRALVLRVELNDEGYLASTQRALDALDSFAVSAIDT